MNHNSTPLQPIGSVAEELNNLDTSKMTKSFAMRDGRSVIILPREVSDLSTSTHSNPSPPSPSQAVAWIDLYSFLFLLLCSCLLLISLTLFIMTMCFRRKYAKFLGKRNDEKQNNSNSHQIGINLTLKQIQQKLVLSKSQNSTDLSIYKSPKIKIETTSEKSAPINEWALTVKLGKGRFGSVRLGLGLNYRNKTELFHPALIPKYAIKRARLHHQRNGYQSPTSQALSILREIKILKRIKHSNIVSFYGSAVVYGKIIMFLEWAPVGSMLNVLKLCKTFPIVVIQKYTMQILNALKFIHSMGMSHRDIKAGNILLWNQTICKIADFGSIQMFSKDFIAERTLCGTIHWQPPENFVKDNSYSLSDLSVTMDTLHAHDIWSLGVTIAEMVNGHPPHHNLNVQEFVNFMKTTPNYNIPNSVDYDLADFLIQCFEIIPQSRPIASNLLKHPFIVKEFNDDVQLSEHNELLDRLNNIAIQSVNNIIKQNQHLWTDDSLHKYYPGYVPKDYYKTTMHNQIYKKYRTH